MLISNQPRPLLCPFFSNDRCEWFVS